LETSSLKLSDSPAVLPAYVARASMRFQLDAGALWAQADAAGIQLPPDLERAVPKRRAEFIAGRLCAARALGSVVPGFAGAIARAADRAPAWPAGVVGSITHADGFASAAVAPAARARGIGIDTELTLNTESLRSVREIAVNADDGRPALGTTEELHYTVLFSAKESVFKCLYPIVRRMFFFEEVGVALLPDGGFRATLRGDLGDDLRAGFTLEGRYVIERPYVHTGVALEL
jgi:enterobactin synthetase component D